MQYAGVNFNDTQIRSGHYAASSFPIRLGAESAGVVVALPTDDSVLKDEEYKQRAFTEGAKVVVVSMPHENTTSAYIDHMESAPQDAWLNTSPSPGHKHMSSLRPSRL